MNKVQQTNAQRTNAPHAQPAKILLVAQMPCASRKFDLVIAGTRARIAAGLDEAHARELCAAMNASGGANNN